MNILHQAEKQIRAQECSGRFCNRRWDFLLGVFPMVFGKNILFKLGIQGVALHHSMCPT
jgi:hypothetical protein